MTSSDRNENIGAGDPLSGLLKAAGKSRWDRPAPVERWNPELCGDIGLEIRRDGSWWYQGSPIGRERIRRLFSRILRKDPDGETYLVTPHEKIRIAVEIAPFLAIRADRQGEDILITTNFEDAVIIGEHHPVRVEETPEGPRIFVRVRGRLEAVLTRPAFYDLIGFGEPSERDPQHLVIRSGGMTFPLGSLEE